MSFRLGVFSGDIYRRERGVVSTDVAFIRFVAGLAPRVRELVVFGRLDPEPALGTNPLPGEVRFVPLPTYRRLTDFGAVLRARRGSRRTFEHELGQLDAVWAFGPHPLAFDLVRQAQRRAVAVFLGVRQDFPRYARYRLGGVHRLWGIPAAAVLDRAFCRLARRLPTVVVGEGTAQRYGRGDAPVLVTGFSLVRDEEIVSSEEALAKNWGGELRVLSVGRLEPEKNPLMLPAVVAGLRGRDKRWRLTVAGEGPLRPELERRAVTLDVADAVEIRGYVPHGPALLELYRSSHVFLHVSRTEGLPQVLFEAEAAGLPIVATDVGGVARALGDGTRGLLVLPGDTNAVVDALDRLRGDVALRQRLIVNGLEHVRTETMDEQLDRLLVFFRTHLARARS
jgi:glycosyltransferase involved in cell wall biosynthesis